MKRLTLILAGFLSILFFANDAHAQFTAKRPSENVKVAPAANAEVSGLTFTIIPAAVKKSATVIVNAERDCWAVLSIKNNFGEMVLEQQMGVSQGENKVPIFFISQLEKGVYTSVLTVEDKVYTTQLIKQ